MKFAKPKPGSKQTLIQRIYERTDNKTINEVIQQVDAWYAEDAARADKAVITAIDDMFGY